MLWDPVFVLHMIVWFFLSLPFIPAAGSTSSKDHQQKKEEPQEEIVYKALPEPEDTGDIVCKTGT